MHVNVTARGSNHDRPSQGRKKVMTFAPVILSLALALAGPVQADDQHHQKSEAASAPGQMMMQGAMKCPLSGAHAEGTLAFLEAQLKIAPAQGPHGILLQRPILRPFHLRMNRRAPPRWAVRPDMP
jgi:hypothetical protein